MVQNNDRGTGGATGKGWKPGQSGNPGGRPKGLAAAVREKAPPHELVRWYAAIWLLDLAELAALGVDPDACTLQERNKAGEWLSERGYGKAPSHAPVEGENPLELDSLERAIGEVVDDLAAKRQAQTVDPPATGKMARTSTG